MIEWVSERARARARARARERERERERERARARARERESTGQLSRNTNAHFTPLQSACTLRLEGVWVLGEGVGDEYPWGHGRLFEFLC